MTLSLFEIAALLLVLSGFFGWFNQALLRLPHAIGLLVMALVPSMAMLALSLPTMEFKPLLLTCIYAVVLFSIIIQGLTVKSVVNRTVDPTLI